MCALVLLAEVANPLQEGWVGEVEGGVEPVSHREREVVSAQFGEGRVQGPAPPQPLGKPVSLVLEPADCLHY